MPVAGMVWKVLKLKDRGVGQYYRWHVEGVCFDAPLEPKTFSWSVPNLDHEAYDLSEAEGLSPALRELFSARRK